MLKKQDDEKNIAKTIDLSHLPEVRGYNFEKSFDFGEFISSYKSTAFQGTHLGYAVDAVNEMRKKHATIFLSCTSNIISSGLREIVKFLDKNRHIQFVVTTAGGIEEDLIKCMSPFHVGTFDIKGRWTDTLTLRNFLTIFSQRCIMSRKSSAGPFAHLKS